MKTVHLKILFVPANILKIYKRIHYSIVGRIKAADLSKEFQEMITIDTKVFKVQDKKTKHQTEHQAARKLLERMLRETYGIETWSLAKDERGKPYLVSHPDIYISISHSHGLAACAVGDRPLGVDIERIRSFKENIWHKVLSTKEQETFASAKVSAKERQELFYRFWTLKESYVKAEGCGFRIPPQDITFLLNWDGDILSGPEGYQFQVEKVRDNYMIASCQKL